MNYIYNLFNTISNFTLVENKTNDNSVFDYLYKVFLVIEKIHITKSKLTKNDLYLLGFNDLNEFVLHLKNLELHDYDNNGLYIPTSCTINYNDKYCVFLNDDSLEDCNKLPIVKDCLKSTNFSILKEKTLDIKHEQKSTYMYVCFILYFRKLAYLNLINPISNFIKYGININIFLDNIRHSKFVLQNSKYFTLFKTIFPPTRNNILHYIDDHYFSKRYIIKICSVQILEYLYENYGDDFLNLISCFGFGKNYKWPYMIIFAENCFDKNNKINYMCHNGFYFNSDILKSDNLNDETKKLLISNIITPEMDLILNSSFHKKMKIEAFFYKL
ncbi:hypothetical protein Hokovirus_2_195 [Hokovirus HKV1]|uniref:Uncharacterized protein n=1 Tax=Hokovirus HKV1 TaxID=1977638 RepID=A0A1V0SGB9_9VIRU|nr:hypothetical protein Hokovirus_2_195 [Hokovirus HKV1]